MVRSWHEQRVLITVRTYPVPAEKGIEVSCTAAISESGNWIRLFPVPYRRLPKDKRFSKYQWIEVALKRARRDPRPESYHLNIETIKLGQKLSPKRAWAERRGVLAPLMRPSLCAIRKERDEYSFPTLGIFRPATIKRLQIIKAATDWTPRQKAILAQMSFEFETSPRQPLEKIPFEFRYEFTCHDSGCRGHRLSCTDWEMSEAYRKWRKEYGDHWERPFRAKFERDMIQKCDTHFYVGTVHQHPKNWIIVGLFYPPKLEAKAQSDFFDRLLAADDASFS